jgi:ribosomal protein S18 acetylase RimI-like enzyme
MQIKRINKTEAHLVIKLFDSYRVFYKQATDIERAKDFIQSRLDNSESVILIALAGDGDVQEPVGFTQLYPTYSSVRTIKNWILNDLYVDAAFRKQGIGESLIQAAMQFAKENNARYVELSTAVDNYSTAAV